MGEVPLYTCYDHKILRYRKRSVRRQMFRYLQPVQEMCSAFDAGSYLRLIDVGGGYLRGDAVVRGDAEDVQVVVALDLALSWSKLMVKVMVQVMVEWMIKKAVK